MYCRVAWSLLLVFTLAGSTAAGSTPSPPATQPVENSTGLRPLRLGHEERWIGNAVCYGPHRDGQHPGGPAPSATEIREDLRLVAPRWKLLRIYAASEFAATLLKLIRDDGVDLKVMLGVWIAPDAPAANRREVSAAIQLANLYPELVLAVSVGNETQVSWSAHRCSPDTLISCVRRVRAGVQAPVTVADDFSYWNAPESRRMAEEIDFITMHAHPMWNGVQLEDALSWLRDRATAVTAMHPRHVVVIGETGWATSVGDQGEQAALIRGRAGELEQRHYYEAVRSWAERERQAVFYFEAFDERWKGGAHPDDVEKHWGLFRADRTGKAAMGLDGGD